MSKLLPAANSPHVEVREVISSVSFDTKPRGRRFFILFFFFLSCPSKTLWRFNSTVWRSSNFASDWKLQSAEQVAASLRVEHKNIFSSPPSLPLCSAPLISRSLSLFLTASSMENCKKIFLPPSSPLALLFLKKEKEKTETHSQLNLLVTAKPLLSHRFSVRPRFLVQMLPAQMSSLMMFLIPTLLTSQPSSTVARFPFFCVCVWTSRGWSTQL